MRSGKLDALITLQVATNTTRPDGAVISEWSDFAKVRAEIIESGTERFFRAYGATDEDLTVFRIRYVAGLLMAHSILFNEKRFRIEHLTEIRRKRGWEIRAVSI
ncbi:phage head closure protein [Agrobacterium vitis]|uniref:Phage head closure protein n=1 Tax=Agrobacterium vitis TaxID=373 RepID=A0AAE5AXC0_AGRVI|nr:phage head closure protein [Agrobacterium vitis]MCF1499637.1 head-tail adaptor protein [Allorhizobium sp. Av2]MCM2440705.1 phage head closure protein [Agrobacterium vitis]MUZ59316.1 phage head closure protein [Agrobacterium vitis]MVA66547.1 phage head closure protein [Agrobacterium vitis]MVA87408.1 phage head closure protein [Agrobacterium vitis]